MIYVVGNSHCNFFTHSHPGNGQVVQGDLFTSIPMWGIVAYNFYEHHINACISANSIPYVSVIKDLIDPDSGLTKMEYFLDFCHLDPSKLFDVVVSKFRDVKVIS